MIALDEDESLPVYPDKVDEVYTLLQSYYGRILRVKTKLTKRSEQYYSQALHTDQRFGRLQGISFLRVNEHHDGSVVNYLNLSLEGQRAMSLKISTLVVEVLQEDTQEWRTVYLGSKERKSK